MPVFAVIISGVLSEEYEHRLLLNKNIIHPLKYCFLVRNCNSAQEAIDLLLQSNTDNIDISPWLSIQVSLPWTMQGAEQNWKLTQQKVIAFLRHYCEDMTDADNASLQSATDQELDNAAEGANPW